ncbi:hypothetical protein J6590_007298 [Homalodisca vitripennis]|nr:hypothetical protein J6590_007298 [Homalodisca vitripennis]
MYKVRRLFACKTKSTVEHGYHRKEIHSIPKACNVIVTSQKNRRLYNSELRSKSLALHRSSHCLGHTMRHSEDANRTTAGVLFCSERPVHISHIESSGTRS